jgi:hypothetical protein
MVWWQILDFEEGEEPDDPADMCDWDKYDIEIIE